MTNPTVLVLGTGAVGAWYGLYLQKARRASVHFLCRSDYAHLKEHGFKLQSESHGNLDFEPAMLNLHASADTLPIIDYVLVCTKTGANSQIINETLPQFVTEKTVIAMIQNGLDNEVEVQERFPNNKVIGGIAYVCAARVSPGVVVHYDRGAICFAAHNEEHKVTPEVEQLVSLYEGSGLTVTSATHLRTVRFQKLIWNIVFNGLSVVQTANTFEITHLDSGVEMAKRIGYEVVKVAKACDCDLEDSMVDNSVNGTKKMFPYKSSMLVDYENKRPLELKYLHHALLRVAAEKGIDIPYTWMLTQLLEYFDQRNRSLIPSQPC
ncbi:hypothetical protein RCL1_005277 [Eukaryota sp. TZLM3-RCL]